jgi:hypothetical protein
MTLAPLFFAASAKGTSLRMGDWGIDNPFFDMDGMYACFQQKS